MADGRLEAQALHFIAGEQQPNGGFLGYASADPGDFSAAEELPTVFCTALIARALQPLPGTEQIMERAAQYLLANQGSDGAWNYWEKGAAIHTPYPDDLDDTACALLALAKYDSALVDGAAWAKVAQLLVRAEVVPGGPYRTWLVPPELRAAWGDIDVAVNANIGGLLALQRVRLQPLEHYIDQAITARSLGSPYYVGSLPAMYFLAPWYKGAALPALRSLLRTELQKKAHTSLELSLLLSASVALGVRSARLSSVAHELRKSAPDGSWPAAGFYVQGASHGTIRYAGCAALTTALALRALHDYEGWIKRPARASSLRSVKTPVILRQALRHGPQLPDADLRTRYRAMVQRIIARDSQRQITGMASHAVAAYGASPGEMTELRLNLGSINGWLAYTVYDDFMDNDGKPEALSVANLALRQTVAQFHAALPDTPAFGELVDRTLDCVDQANQWEVMHARATVDGKIITCSALPDFGAYDQLADKSWGHMLAASGIVMSMRLPQQTRELRNLQAFFRHYLIARQLNDDAHDWESDLAQGRLSAAVTLLLTAYGAQTIVLDTELPTLRLLFWEQTIVELAERITREAGLARRALMRCSMHDRQVFLSWLTPLEAAATQALTKRAETKQFIAEYQQTTG